MEDLRKFYKNKKVFVTGHTGFKGAWLCRILFHFGAEICGYALKEEDGSLFSLLQLERKMQNVTGDIRDLEQLKKTMMAFEPEIVFHMAAQPLVLESYLNPVYTYETNVLGTVNVLEALRYCQKTKSFLNVTTDKVYENREWCWGYRENENLCGYDPYSNSKSCSELVTYSYKQSFFQDETAPAISTARSGNVIGGGDFSANRIIPDCIKAAAKGEVILVRNPNSIRPYQHVLECLYGYLLLSMKQYQDKKYEGAYNFGPEEDSCVTTGELVSLFCESWNERSTQSLASWNTERTTGLHEANYLKLDCSKAKSVLGWKPKWSVKEAIEKVVDWEKGYKNGKSRREVTDFQIREFFNEKDNSLLGI